MKRRKMYNFSCSGLVAMIFALFGIGVSTSNEVVTRVSDNQGEAQTTTVIADVTESYDDINATTEKIEETKECYTETTTTVQTTITNIETTYKVRTEELVTEELIFEDVDVTTEEVENEIVPETAIETTTTTIEEKQEDGLFDCLVIDWQVIPIVRLPATQKNVDLNDVVLDTSRWSTERDFFFFGHNMQSFAFLHWVNVGDVIKFYDGNEEKLYVVERSERGDVTEDELYIISKEDGTDLVYTDFGYESIRLITCYGSAVTGKRWVVIARKI